jgi:hypothetical protein
LIFSSTIPITAIGVEDRAAAVSGIDLSVDLHQRDTLNMPPQSLT